MSEERFEGGPPSSALSRRAFLGRVGGAAAAAVAAQAIGPIGPVAGPAVARAAEVGPLTPAQRRVAARRVRIDAADLAFGRPHPDQRCNGEEDDYGKTRIANFSKGLPHNARGEVDRAAYNRFLDALKSGDFDDFERIPLGGDRPLRNPLAGLAFELEGPDGHQPSVRAAPRIDRPQNSAEAAELYWMALARDVRFTDYDSSPLIERAARDLSRFSDFRGPKRGRKVTPQTIFRGDTAGDLAGPYLSQFLLRDIPYGSLAISQRQQTVVPGMDYMTGYADWLAIQRGISPSQGDLFDAIPRYIRNGRDLGQYVHIDALYEAYLNACLILLGIGAPFDRGNPYNDARKQDGFATFGGPHILSLVTEVATRALKAVWYQKWFVHRRLRPEAFGGRVHNQLIGAATYPIDREILSSDAVDATRARYGTFLLPQAFPEGSPIHPSYGAGHATVAGACVTILKAWFDASYVLPNPVVPSADGLALVPVQTSPLTVGGELDKVAANISFGRNFAGIHWRSDYSESVKLGEAIAIGVLEEQKATYAEDHSLTLIRFDGTKVTI